MNPVGRAAAAAASLATALLAVAGAVVYIIFSPYAALMSGFTVSAAMVCGWYAAGHRRHRPAWVGGAVLALAATLALLLDTRRDAGLAVAIVVLAVLSVVSARVALRHGVVMRRAATGTRAERAERPVLLVNPRSGDGKAARTGLVEAARDRGIPVIELQPGDDLAALALKAIVDGADTLGMAGGDGSQALVAQVCSLAGVALVCIASGTRNHFAADLGLDRRDVVAGLDAFDDALECQIDLGLIVDGAGTERVFVNNVVMGVYGKAVQSPGYRTAKRATVIDTLQRYAGPEAFDLRFAGPDEMPHPAPDLLFVGNNPYQMTNLSGFGSRSRLDAGALGIVSVRIDHPDQLAHLAVLEAAHHPKLFPGWREWTTTEFRVDSGAPIEAGIDGEPVTLVPPVRFTVVPGTVRVRVPRQVSRSRLRIPAPIRTLVGLAKGLRPRPDARAG